MTYLTVHPLVQPLCLLDTTNSMQQGCQAMANLFSSAVCWWFLSLVFVCAWTRPSPLCHVFVCAWTRHLLCAMSLCVHGRDHLCAMCLCVHGQDHLCAMCLCAGPPGTGKTSLCKALAQKLSIVLQNRYRYTQLVEINSHSLFSKWFSEVRHTSCVILLVLVSAVCVICTM